MTRGRTTCDIEASSCADPADAPTE